MNTAQMVPIRCFYFLGGTGIFELWNSFDCSFKPSAPKKKVASQPPFMIFMIGDRGSISYSEGWSRIQILP